MKTPTLIILVLFCLIITTYGQFKPEIRNFDTIIDSLLLEGDIKGASNFINMNDSFFETTENMELRNKYNKLKDSFRNIIDYCNNFNVDDTAKTNNYIANILSKKELFRIEYAGEEANKAFQKSVIVINDDFRTALLYFQIAIFLKNKFLKITEEEIKETIAFLRNEISRKNYEKANNQAQLAIERTKIFPTLTLLLDSLSLLKLEIENKITERERQKNYWEQNEIVDYSGILLHISTINQNKVREENINFYDYHSDKIEIIEIDNIPSTFRFGFNIGGNIHVYDFLSIGFNYCYSKNVFSNSMSSGGSKFFDFDIHNNIFDIYSKLLFRRKAGFRPYCTLGVGYLNSLQTKSVGTIIYKDNIIRKYRIKENQSDIFRIIASLGAEYVPSGESILLYFLNILLSHNLQDIKFIGNSNFALSVGIGVIIF